MKIDKGGFINDFIEKNLRQYIIPVYQRDYTWSAEQCEDLFADIIQAQKLDRYHFTGSVVYELFDSVNKIDQYVIIDGQQRLTTIYILLKALIDCAESEGEKETLKSLLFNQDKFKQYNIDESSKLKLKPVKSDNQQLLLLMEDRVDEMDKSSGIYINYALFKNLINKALNDDPDLSIEKIYDGIKNLTCATIKLEDEEKGKEQEIFERINSTGVPLGLADKIRNYVLMTDVDQEKLFTDYWLKIQSKFTKEELESFFLDYLNLRIEGFTREKEAYDSFKALYRDGNYTNESMLSEMLHYAEFYEIFLKGDNKLGVEVNNALDGLRRLKQTTVYLFLYKVFDDYKCDPPVIDETVLAKVLNFFLNYSIRRMTCEIPSNSLRGFYKTLYSRVFSDQNNKVNYYDAIVSFMTQLTSKDVVPDDTDFSTALKEKNLYRKNALCKYLLAAIENQGKEKIVIDNLSIEHIMPQNRNLSDDWRKMLGNNWAYIQDKYLHTLGNLTLTGYNSELGDRKFSEKKDLLKNPETPSHITILYKDVIDKNKWTEKEIKDRATILADIVIKLFPIEKPTTKIVFNEPGYREYTVADPDDATWKTVNYYEILGERVNVDSFAVMVRSVANKLYELDNTIIERMAKNNEKFPGWNIPAFSYDVESVRGEVELRKGTGIYINSNFSARDSINFISALLKAHSLDIMEDFVYSAKSNKETETSE